MAQVQKTIPIDTNKLRPLLQAYCKANKMNVVDLARQLGFSDSYFSDVFSRGTIRQFVITYLDRECGIKYESYKPDEPKKLTDEETGDYLAKMELGSINEKLDILTDKLDELIKEIHLLGNVNVTGLEEFRELKNMLK